MPDTALLKLQTGPVLDFIAPARTLRDLWAGSWLLSHLTRTAALTVRDTPGVELLGPGLENPGDPLEASTPHFLLARVPVASAGHIARAAEEALHTEWNRIAQAVHAFVAKCAPPGWDAGWDRQVALFPEVDWIVHPCPDDFWALRLFAKGEPPLPEEAPDFGKAGSSLEGLHLAAAEWKFAACRNSRAFAPWPGSPVPKDPLDGFREVLGGESCEAIWEGMRKQECLGQALNGLRRCGALTLIKRLFPEAYLRDELSWHPFAPGFDPVQHLAAAIDAGDGQVPPGSPVSYAILALDGDDLGRWFIGRKNGPGNLNPLRAGYQAALFHRLSDFATRASGIAGQHVGQAIYCGSGDVLALLPAASALPCADELVKAFSRALPGVTASAGIAFAHVRTPLQDAVRAARAALASAKQIPGKDAFCLRLLQSGGGHVEFAARWRSGVVKVWRDLEERKRALPHRFAQSLAERLRRLLASHAEGHDEGCAREWTYSSQEASLLELTHALQFQAGLPRQEAGDLAQSWHLVLTRLPPRDALRFWFAWAFLRRTDDTAATANPDADAA